ncbi:MAG TPA: hypothetical protein VGI40_07750 [Pirellulaceae bacterium]|jgi:hypothetical protein
MCKALGMYAALIASLFGAFPLVAVGQDEGLPAIAREVYQPRTGLPPAATPRVVTERLVTEPAIVPPPVVDDTPTVAGAVVAPGAVIAPTVAATWPSAFARYAFGFYDDGNADDNWYYDYYQVPKAAVVVKPPTDALPGFRTNWTYDRREEAGLFSW